MPKSKKILLSIPALQGGGAERVMSTLANGWVAEGHNVCFVTYEPSNSKPYYKLNTNINVVQLDTLTSCKYAKPMILIKRFFGLRDQIKKFNPDIVISFLDTNNIMAVFATLGLDVPVVVSERINPKTTPIGKVKKFLRNWAYCKASSLVVQNKGIKECFSTQIQKNTSIIPNPIVLENNINWTGGKKEFVALGRISIQKGYTYLIDAFSKVSKKHPDWTLKIIGKGNNEDSKKLEKQIQTLGMEGRIFLKDAVKEPQKEIAQSKIFVFSSIYEGMPNSLMEAMAIGMPVISADCDFGPSDLINNGKNGILVPIKDSLSLAKAMEKLADDSALQKKLGNSAKKDMEQYELRKILNLWQNVFEKLTKKYE